MSTTLVTLQPYRCQSCRWWQRDDVYKSPKWKPYKDAGFGFCRCDYHLLVGTLPHFSAMRFQRNTVIHEADENWGMVTGPDHGCVDWKGRDDEQ